EHVAAAGELELDRLDPLARLAVAAGDPAAPEAAVDDKTLPARGERRVERLPQFGAAARAAVRAEIEHRQLAVEEARDAGADRMRVEQGDAGESRPEPRDLPMERVVIRVKVGPSAPVDLDRVRNGARIERLAVEGRRRAEPGRRLTRIERGGARVAIDVDDRARQTRPHERRAEGSHEIIELVEPPVGILGCPPRTDEALLVLPQFEPAMRNADDQRRFALPDLEPVRMRAHRGASRTGSSPSPTASTIAPSRASRDAVRMSG